MSAGPSDPEAELDPRFRVLLDVSSDAIFLATPEGRVLHANRAACRMFGYSQDEIRTLSRSDICVEDERLRSGIAVRAQRGVHSGALTLVRKGGERFDGELTSLVIPSASGEDRLWIVVHDLTEQKRAKESEEAFRALSEASFEGIFLHRDGVVILANAAMDRMYHAPPGGLVGKPLLDYVAPEDHALALRRVAERYEAPYEATAVRADGTRFPAEVQARTGPIDFQGEPTRVVAVRDVSARKQLEAQLVLADRMASLGTLAAGVAHEINNPLAAVMLNLELAQNALAQGKQDDALMAERLAAAAESAERVRRIVKDLRALARPAEEPPAPVDLEAVLAYVRDLASYEIRHRAHLEMHVDPIGPVHGVRARLEQVVLNLVVNAAQAIPDDGRPHRIDVSVHAEPGDRFAIVVKDTGVGIPPELRARIFDPFVTTKEVGVGTGLGLAISHSIVTSLGGTIDVESEVGRGSTFRVVLPRGTAKEDVAVPEPPVPHAARGRLLVIDDERHIRDVLVQLLDGHDVTAVAGAEPAIELLARGERYDAILCDLMMPRMTGADFHDEVERRWPELLGRVLLMTGGAVTPRSQDVLRRAKNPPLDKPFSAPTLEARVAEMVANARP